MIAERPSSFTSLIRGADAITPHSAALPKRFLKVKALSGMEIVDGAARLCAMDLFLHGIGGEESVAVRDALSSKGSVEFDMVLTNPPFF